MAEVPVHIGYPALANTGQELKQRDYLALRFDRFTPAPLSTEQRRAAEQTAMRTEEFRGGQQRALFEEIFSEVEQRLTDKK